MVSVRCLSLCMQRMRTLKVLDLSPSPHGIHHSISLDHLWHLSIFAIHSVLHKRWWLSPLSMLRKLRLSHMPPCKRTTPTLGISGCGGCASKTHPPPIMANQMAMTSQFLTLFDICYMIGRRKYQALS
jgi:hypothetical protein